MTDKYALGDSNRRKHQTRLDRAHLFTCRLPPYDTVHYIGLALLTSCLGIFGDAIESLVKRVGNIKDSGVFFPGHGGILDRFDAFFVSGTALPLPKLSGHTRISDMHAMVGAHRTIRVPLSRTHRGRQQLREREIDATRTGSPQVCEL